MICHVSYVVKTTFLGANGAAHFVLIPEVADCAALLDEGEALPFERDFRRNRPHIVDRHRMGLIIDVSIEKFPRAQLGIARAGCAQVATVKNLIQFKESTK